MQRPFRRDRRYVWTLAAAIVGVALYVAALRNDFYQLTSPATLSWHVALRKLYSVAAFGTLGYLVRRGFAERGRERIAATTVGALAAYSAAIELGQCALGSTEGLVWNVVDIACGALGGLIATTGLLRPARNDRRPDPATASRPRSR